MDLVLQIFLVSTGGDGPYDGLLLSGNTLYGTTAFGDGTVFAINTDGSGFTNLYFLGEPNAYLISSGNSLYGTTVIGTIFSLNTNGLDFSNLYTFTAVSDFTNSD